MTGRRIAIIKWNHADGIADVIGGQLFQMGHAISYFLHDQPVPVDNDIILSFAPYGRLMPLICSLAGLPRDQRPFYIHWNFEELPSLHMGAMWGLGLRLRTMLDRADRWPIATDGSGGWSKLIERMNGRLTRVRNMASYSYATRLGVLDCLVDISALHCQVYREFGIPSLHVPWGGVDGWYADLGLQRDIDVLWFGKRRTARRSRILDRVRSQLAKQGVNMLVIDGVEHPFIYGDERTEILNRTKIALNVLTQKDDKVLLFRLPMAACNRSMVVSEHVLPHCAELRPDEHYVSTAPDTLADTILHHLEHDAKRSAIVENAYKLYTDKLTLAHSLDCIMEHAESRLSK